MKQSFDNILTAKSQYQLRAVGKVTHKNSYIDYQYILDSYGFEYIFRNPYLSVNYNGEFNGWILHISIVRQQMENLLTRLLPFLQDRNLPFDLPLNSVTHDSLLGGGYGFTSIGKIINVYVKDSIDINEVAYRLAEMTSDLIGPKIPTAYQLTNCVFASNADYVDLSLTPKLLRNQQWPFAEFKCSIDKPVKWLSTKYFLIQLLKADAKGNVYKSFNFSKWNNISWCIIKQGKKHQCFDDAGRSVANRLKWQYELQSKFKALINIPTPIDFFERDGDCYFVMEYIEGESYNNAIGAIQAGQLWEDIDQSNKILIVELLIQIIDLVQIMHINGVIHRDLSPENFIVSTGNKVYAIDIELAYDFQKQEPSPFFTLGTEGYMSSHQRTLNEPQFEDDIYGLGALLIRTFTGISPTKFPENNGEELYDALSFFINNQRLLTMICSCWDSEPSLRPSIQSLKHNLELYSSMLLSMTNISIQNRQVDRCIDFRGDTFINSIWKKPLITDEQTWFSKTINDNPQISNDQKNLSWYPGFGAGIAGILYLLSLADYHGYDLGSNRDVFYNNLDSLKLYFDQTEIEINPGLFNGKAGMAVLIATMIKHGQLENSLTNLDQIKKNLNCHTTLLNLSDGIVGQGIAMIQCSNILGFPAFSKGIDLIVDTIMKQQNQDGSWDVKKSEENKKGIKIFSLFHGIAGITYFQMICGEIHYNKRAKISALNGLTWLLKARKSINGTKIWTVNAGNTNIEPWVEYGFSGVAFLFIKAFEIYKNPEYKEASIAVLLMHPARITSNYISQASGLAGLGEVYLEAYHVFGDIEWKNRATHIYEFFRHTSKQNFQNGYFWLDGSENKPTPEFMSGHSGILHFLLRYQNPSKIKFPLLSF